MMGWMLDYPVSVFLFIVLMTVVVLDVWDHFRAGGEG